MNAVEEMNALNRDLKQFLDVYKRQQDRVSSGSEHEVNNDRRIFCGNIKKRI